MAEDEREKKTDSDQQVNDEKEKEKANGLKFSAGADGCGGVDDDTPIDLERGITIGSLDAADIPIPTNLQRSLPSPGAYGQPGPRAGLTEISVGSDHSISNSSNNNNNNDEILVTARLVDDESHHNDITNATVTSAGTKPTLVVAVPAPQDDEDGDSNLKTPQKNHKVFWTRRNKVIAFILGGIVLGVVIGLSLAVAGENGGPATAVTPAVGTRGDNAASPGGGSGASGNDGTSSSDQPTEEGSDDRATTTPTTTASTAPDRDEKEEEEENHTEEDNTDD